MANSKKEFLVQFNCTPERAEQLIFQYLQAHRFSKQDKGGANYFQAFDPLLKGKYSLEYYINGNEIRFWAYLGSFERPRGLDGFVGIAGKKAYQGELNVLFNAIRNA